MAGKKKLADPGAAGIVPAVRAHEEQVLAEGGAEARALSRGDRGKVEFAKFRRIGQLPALEPRGSAGPARVYLNRRGGTPPPGTPDELDSHGMPPGQGHCLGDRAGEIGFADLRTPGAGMLDQQPCPGRGAGTGQTWQLAGVTAGAVRAVIGSQWMSFREVSSGYCFLGVS